MKYSIVLIILLSQLFCNDIANSKENPKSILESLSLFLVRRNRVTVEGAAVKGIIKQGIVVVNPVNKDGSCNTAIVLSSGQTDESGAYSLVYARTGGLVCITVSGDPGGNTKMFDEKTNKEIALTSGSNFKLTSVLPENKIIGSNRKGQLASPFSKFAAARFQSLAKKADSNTDMNELFKRASREVVIRFGLNTGLSAASTKSELKMKTDLLLNINDSGYPDLEDILIELENPKSPLSAKFMSILVGFSYLANKHKKGNVLTIEDIDSIINAFIVDFEDGLFDGKGSDGKPITIGYNANQVTFPSTPLTSIVLPAAASYIQEGGKLTVGSPNSSSMNITMQDITSQIKFEDNTPIISNFGNSAPTLSYTGSPFALTPDIGITTITPTTTGTITSCTSSPAMPTGLSLNSTTCAISGTPTVWQAITNYNITATNSLGSVTATISLAVTSNGATWSARTLPSSSNWIAVAYGNGVFAAVAQATTAAASSTDGINWTARAMPTASAWITATYGNGVFVAIAQNTTIASTSPDGINWTNQTLPSSSNWISVTFGNGLFVTVAATSNIAATSPDGVNWTSRTLPSSSGWRSVSYGNGVYVAIADGPSTIAASSTDGINWTARTLPTSAGWMSVTFGNGIFAAVANGSNSAASSTDGINWTARTLPSSTNWRSVSFGNGVFAAVAMSSSIAATSIDGMNWTARTLPSTSTWTSVVYGNGIFSTVAGGPSTTAATSP